MKPVRRHCADVFLGLLEGGTPQAFSYSPVVPGLCCAGRSSRIAAWCCREALAAGEIQTNPFFLIRCI